MLPNLEALLEQCRTCKHIAEIGVADGSFSERILSVCNPSKLYLIDAWEMPFHPIYGEGGLTIIQTRFKEQIVTGQVEIWRGLSHEIIPTLPVRSLDLVYIDASHDYDSVKADLELVRSKMEPRGLIAGHDYVKWAGHCKRFGVVEAVNEFCIDFDFEFAFLTMDANNNWSYALRRMDQDDVT